jgi:hypothetical protein
MLEQLAFSGNPSSILFPLRNQLTSFVSQVPLQSGGSTPAPCRPRVLEVDGGFAQFTAVQMHLCCHICRFMLVGMVSFVNLEMAGMYTLLSPPDYRGCGRTPRLRSSPKGCSSMGFPYPVHLLREARGCLLVNLLPWHG